MVIADYLSVMSLDAATLHPLERFEAADIAGDKLGLRHNRKRLCLPSMSIASRAEQRQLRLRIMGCAANLLVNL